ncbi:hypothetical protein CO058_02525 [candidate division WWE3 bacterium CG_4_9_14_0_2_um_filter_35_11]|uniref:Ribbon-helix-helix protein CopG domain-containing protein n=1 Tax=candidate division WWE3 bacterium CG_4_9_14_0_2_um_filter_35_11 TaxID=1975077 RepID=A0A2M8ELL4_UNCKA|nr:MAG: hypothetical protein COV25_02785 [candidate division WWE3 bacterium CG10_big_fil_rev_8_21_14_0_10_35_32]PJC23610.1 MAG: hypothetical protein CO058_02525 [candidate division WWE3 bacterium CG_4_9_14_0_2_um_filter_35_11]
MLIRTQLMLDKGIKADLEGLSHVTGKSYSELVRIFLREMIEKEKVKKNARLTGKQLALKIKKFAVKGVGTPVDLQDKYIYGV